MRVSTAKGLRWLCSVCGHDWRIKDEGRPPVHCAMCGHRGWNTDREVTGELEGA
jgi:rubrerythrin